MELQIKDEFKNLIPPLTVEEFKQLEDNCIAEGIRDAIVTWQGFIIDGHNRYEIAQKHGLKFRVEEKEFEDEKPIKIWMAKNQLGRRNLADYVMGELYDIIEQLEKEKGKEEKSKAGGDKKSLLSIMDKSDNKTINERHNTQKIVADKLGWSTGKKARFDVVKKKAPEEVKEKLRNKEMTINQAYEEIKKKEKKANFEAKKNEFEKPIKEINTNQIIIKGDCLEVLPTLEVNTFDLLLSDPPYGMDFKSGWSKQNKIQNDKIEDTISLFENTLKLSVPLLKDNAHFYLFGNIDYMPQIKPIIEKYLTLKNILIWDRKVIGMGDLKTYGNSYDIVYFGYNKIWKDLNGPRDRDILEFNRVVPSKMMHPTEKPLDLLEYIIKKSTNENDKILEPFAGGGSTLLAAKNTNRMATGIEIEEEYFNLIIEKI
jgi:DNA modification methylase